MFADILWLLLLAYMLWKITPGVSPAYEPTWKAMNAREKRSAKNWDLIVAGIGVVLIYILVRAFEHIMRNPNVVG